MVPLSTGKRIAPTARDLLWFQKLQEHGPLPTAFLLAFAAEQGRSEKRARERLTDLFNETETKHGGRYLKRPPQQFRTLDSRYNQLVHDLAPAGATALRDAGVAVSGAAPTSGPWVHRCMVACVTASVELATRIRGDVSFIPGHRVLARAGADLRCPVTIRDPSTGMVLTKDLIPDGLFGLEYRTVMGSRFRFFVLECDRATEPAATTNVNRKSWQRSLRQYGEYVGGGRYRQHLQLTAPLLVLNVTTNAARQARLTEFAEQAAGSVPYLLFQTWEDFGPIFKPPQPRPALLEAAWQRPGHDPLYIDRP